MRKKKKETYGVPAFLSLILPGLGQIVKNQIVKGVIILVITLIILFLSFLSIWGEGIEVFLMFIFMIIFWVWNISDAYNSQVD